MKVFSLEALVYLYFFLAIAYNVASIAFKDVTGRALAPTDPILAIVMLSAFFLIYAASSALHDVARTLLILVYLGLISRFGIVAHWKSYSDDRYYSRFWWVVAITINIFGVIVIAMTLLR